MKDAVDLLEDELVTLASRIGAAEYRFLECVRKLEEVIHLIDCTYVQWLGWRLGIDKKTAYERVRVARALAALPKIAEAFAKGLLSYSKVRVVTRVASAETDGKFLEHALDGNVRQLEKLVSAHRVVLPDEAKKHMELRHFSIREDEESGMYVVHGRLAADDVAWLKKALAAAESAGAESKVDALVQVAQVAVENLATGDEGVLHVETNRESGCCSVEGHAIAETVADRLACEQPDNRLMSTTQRRELMRRQGGGCAYPKCTHTRHLHGHHIVPWSEGGKTTLDNLVLICSKHHRWLHEGGHQLLRDNGQTVFLNQHGEPVSNAPALPPVAPCDSDLATTVPDTTARVRGWSGDKLDLDFAVYGLLRAHGVTDAV